MRKLLLSVLVVTAAFTLGCPSGGGGTGGGGGSSTGGGSGGGGGAAGGGGGAAGGGGGATGGGGGATGGGGGGAMDAGTEITVFARDLILGMTANNNLPTTTEDKGLIDVNPITFDAGFFP